MDLSGKIVLITGGRRVGQVVAAELKQAGATLAMTYYSSPDEVARNAEAFQLDITNEDSVRTIVKEVTQKLGRIDALINMASVFESEPKELSFATIHKTFAVNAFGGMLLSRLFAEAARERGASLAPIVSFIDWAIDHPYKYYDTYLAAKAAFRHYLMALQSSFNGTIRVVNVHPGMILEPPDFPAAQKATIIANTPTKTIGDPQQAAKLVRLALELDFLVENIRLDGGQHWRHRL